MSLRKFINFAGISSAFLLGILPAFFTLTPLFQTSNADATTYQNSSANTTAIVEPAISITATNVEIPNLSPSGSDITFGSAYSTVTVTTNNETGYTLSLHDTDTNTSLVHQDNSSYTIPSLTTDTNKNNLTASKWGYSTDNTTYKKIPSSTETPAEVGSTNTAINQDIKHIYFGVGINSGTTYGTYQDTVTFTATTNQVPDTFWNIETMQQMTSQICGTATTPNAKNGSTIISALDTNASHIGDKNYVPSRTLTDARDNHTYTVRKLADGNCWMTSHLNLEASQMANYNSSTRKATLTPNDSDVTANVEVPASISVSQFSSSYTESYIVNNTDTDSLYSYNTHAAWAFPSGTTVNASISPTTSICPKNWQLPPKSTANKSYDYLINTTYQITGPATGTWDAGYYNSGYDSNTLTSAPFNFVTGSTELVLGENSSRSSNTDYYASIPYANDRIGFADYNGGGNGKAIYHRHIRCVAK